MQEHNKMFMVSNFMEDQIMRFYRVPEPDVDTKFMKFRYSSEIMEKIGYCPALSRHLSLQNLNTVMTNLGFKKVHRSTGNGWIVIEKQEGGAKLRSHSFAIGTDALTIRGQRPETSQMPS